MMDFCGRAGVRSVGGLARRQNETAPTLQANDGTNSGSLSTNSLNHRKFRRTVSLCPMRDTYISRRQGADAGNSSGENKIMAAGKTANWRTIWKRHFGVPRQNFSTTAR